MTPRKQIQSKRVEFVLRIDVPSKDFDMRKVSDKAVNYFALCERKIGGNLVSLTMKEVPKHAPRKS